MGSKGTWTPLHTDVLTSYSWSTNVCGKKKWTLFPPSEGNFLKDSSENLVFDIGNVDATKFPLFSQARRIVITQEAGETIFVPSGWFHQVENLVGSNEIEYRNGIAPDCKPFVIANM
jgi:oxalate decarboxylase/phosphoglucose isomerase-like protein (cupin superfamily)